MMNKYIILIVASIICTSNLFGQVSELYDEHKVPNYILPNPLVNNNGKEIRDTVSWWKERRPELMELFTEEVYGKFPEQNVNLTYQILEEGLSSSYTNTFRQQVKITLSYKGHQLHFTMLLYLPKNKTKVPVFLEPNFYGNHTITTDTAVMISKAWAMNNKHYHIANHTLTEASRGTRADRWSVQRIIDAGFGLATFYYGEIDPDKNDFSDGIHPFFYKSSQTCPGSRDWGSIGAWSWGMSRALDYLQRNPVVDANKVILMGHSRLGKAALWAGANDERFAAVISNNSGCMGAALSKRCFGERIDTINTVFPHWFCKDFKQYNNQEADMTFDQHELIALIAPRPVYIASAKEDLWADPKGEFLAAYFATPVYNLFGKSGITDSIMPPLHQPVHNTVAYHIRAGEHYVTDYDWEQYIKWAQQIVLRK